MHLEDYKINTNIDILAFETYAAPHKMSQLEYLCFQEKNIPQWSEAFTRLVLQTGVEQRYSYLAHWQDFFAKRIPTSQQRNNEFKGLIYPEVISNLENFLKKYQIDRAQIGAIITVSCTGITNPSLDTLVASDLKLESCLHWHIGFMGCQAGLVGLQSAAGVCCMAPGKIALVICVEACSLHYQTDLDTDVQISNALFSDGCAIIAMQKAQSGFKQNTAALFQLECAKSTTRTYPQGANLLTWNLSQSGWRMGLSLRLPNFISQVLKHAVYAGLPNSTNLVVHPGGKSILKAVETGLALDRNQLDASFQILKYYGNMSSPSIFFCLQEFLKRSPKLGEQIELMAFGPGLDVSSVSLIVGASSA